MSKIIGDNQGQDSDSLFRRAEARSNRAYYYLIDNKFEEWLRDMEMAGNEWKGVEGDRRIGSSSFALYNSLEAKQQWSSANLADTPSESDRYLRSAARAFERLLVTDISFNDVLSSQRALIRKQLAEIYDRLGETEKAARLRKSRDVSEE